MDTITVFDAKDQLEELIQAANEEKQQYRIASEKGSVIVLPEETYENLLVTLELLSTPGLLDNLKFPSPNEFSDKIELISHAIS